MRFLLVTKSMTSEALERPKSTLAERDVLWSPLAKCRPMILVTRNITYTGYRGTTAANIRICLILYKAYADICRRGSSSRGRQMTVEGLSKTTILIGLIRNFRQHII